MAAPASPPKMAAPSRPLGERRGRRFSASLAGFFIPSLRSGSVIFKSFPRLMVLAITSRTFMCHLLNPRQWLGEPVPCGTDLDSSVYYNLISVQSIRRADIGE